MPRRILLKISGEVLQGNRPSGIDPEFTHALAKEIEKIHKRGIQIAIVIGGGNIFRGIKAAANGMDRTTADYMGMLATIMNGLALQEAFENSKVDARVLSAIDVPQVCAAYAKRKGMVALEEGQIVILTGGTGNPYFTTDSAAALYALELECTELLKGTKVDGVYDKDPTKFPDAKLYKTITHNEVIQQNLKVMDQTAFALCRDYKLPIRVFNMTKLENISKAIKDANFGTSIR